MARNVTLSVIGLRPPPSTGSVTDAVRDITRYLTTQINQVLPDRPDLVILPEVCDLPCNYELTSKLVLNDYLDARGDRVLESLKQLASEHHCYITYPALRRVSDGSLRNSVQLIDRLGEVVCVYDKCHPTIWEIESGIVPGANPAIAECDFGRVGFIICFDLNFDITRTRYAQLSPDIVAFCSMYHGGLMQRYWAYACRAHLASAISGSCGTGQIVSPLGELIASSTNYHNFVTMRLNLDCCLVHLDYNVSRLHAIRAKYGTKVRIVDPGLLGSVLLFSETPEFSVNELIREFQIEPLDDYFARALDYQVRHRTSSSAI